MKPAPRITTALCLAAAVLFTVGCGSSTPPPEETPTPVAATQPVQVDEGLQSVDVTVVRNIMDPSGELTDEQIVTAAKENGMTAVINSDGSVTFTMSRAQQQEMLDSMRASIDESVAEMVNDPENSFTAVDMNDDLSQFTVQVDTARFSGLEAFYAIAFYVGGGLYQQFNGVTADDLNVQVDFVDYATGEVIDSGTLRDWLDSMEQPE